MRARSVLTSIVVLASSILVQVGTATPAAAATVLPIEDSVFDVVVDGTHDLVFVSGGPGQGSVAALDYDGNLVATLSVPGASGMAIVDDTLFIAAADADEISTVDTSVSPLAVSGHLPTAPLTDPGSLAYVAGELWFTTGACGSAVQHAHMDINGANVSTAVTLNADSCPRYATDPDDTDLLLMFDEGESPMTLSEYDMSTEPPTLAISAANPDGSSGGEDAVFAPTGATFVTAATSATSFAQVKTSDLTLIRSYTAAASPDAVDITSTGGGQVVGGSDTHDGDSLWVYLLGTSTATNTFDLPGEDAVVPRGVAWADDGTRIFAVASRSTTSALRLYVFEPSATDSTLTLDATPGTVKVGDRVTLSGTLAASDASSVEGETVSLLRTDATGTQKVGDAEVGADGTYSLRDEAHVGGQATYLARFGGTVHVKPSETTDAITVKKLVSHVSIKVSDPAVTFGRSVRVTGHLGAGTQSRVLELYAKPYGANRKLLKKAKVDGHGNLSATYTPNRNTTFIARFDGDLRHRSAEDHVGTKVRVILKAALKNYKSTSGRYKIYGKGAKAPVLVHVSPNHAGYHVKATLQAFVNGSWRLVDTGSFKLNASSYTAFAVQGSSNVNFRVQVRMPTHADHLGDASPWLYLRFT
jgi:hypothetical protein